MGKLAEGRALLAKAAYPMLVTFGKETVDKDMHSIKAEDPISATFGKETVDKDAQPAKAYAPITVSSLFS